MSSTVPFPAAAARPEYLDTAVSDEEESSRGGRDEEGVGRREEQRGEDEEEDEEEEVKEVKEAKDNAEEEGDPDLLLFHNQGNVGDRNGEDGPEAPVPSSSPPPPPAKPSRGGTPIGSSKTSSKNISSARSSGVGGDLERRSTRSHQQRHHQQQQQSEESRIGTGTGSGVGGVTRGGLEWVTIQHLDLTPARAGLPDVQPHAAAFHHSQALFAAAVGKNIIEYDALTGCKLSSIDIGAAVVRMSYSPAGGHIIVAVLEDWTIRSWDLDTEHTYVLYSPGEKKSTKVPGGTVEVHIALTPLRPWLFFGAHHRMSVNVVGTIEGVRAATRIKTDLKKPITDLACHPRSPLLYVAYADGLVRAYNIQNFSVQYTLQVDPSIKLIGAGSFAFHSLLEWVFVGDRSGALLAWDVSVPNRPTMIGITQVGNNPIAAMSWHSMLQLLLTLSREGSVQVWRPRVVLNPRKDHLRANFFEPAGLETMDVGNILTQFGGVPVYPIPRIVNLFVHPKLNLATVLFATMAAGDEESKKKALIVSRESRKQLFAVLQGARGSPASVLKEKLSALGSAGILQGHQLLQQARAQAGGAQVTMSDLARKAFLYGNSNVEQVRSGPILTLPLLTIADYNHLLRDVPVCQPLQQELMFFNSEQRIFNYPVRVFFMDGCNLTSYNLTNGDYNVYKKLSATATGGNERTPKHMIYSSKHHLFLIFFECRGAPSEVVRYRDPQGLHALEERTITLPGGCDGAFTGRHESQYVILEDDGMGLTLFFLEDPPDLLTVAGEEGAGSGPNVAKKGPVVPDAIKFEDGETDADTDTAAKSKKPQKAEARPPVQFVFDSPVQRVFSCPLETTVLYVLADSHLGLAKVSPDAYTTVGGHLLLSTKPEAGKFLKLNPLERVLQVRWQETRSGQAAGIMTTQRVLITSGNLEVLSSTSATWDKGFPPFRSLVWAGPSLIFSTSTAVVILGWDGVARPLATIGTPNAALVGALNDRLLLACANDPNPRNRQMVEIKTRLLGLLEPLLIGWTTLQKTFEPKLDLTEIMYQLTSRFDNLRVTPRSLDTLSKGPPICGDLAVELAQSGPQFTQELRCTYAIRARRFDTALGILKDEFLRSRDYPKCPPSTRLFQRFRELGHACIKFGQFDYAKETFEVVSDYESLLDLFICHLNPSALRHLLQKLDQAKADPELRRHVDKILAVRSVGWGQGGAFANLTAESMAPKALEWGGGNWQIQTTPAAKGVPHWELSGEVTAYMKTMNGAIPTMIPDHIGVYLGTLKGRGTVVEVQETRHGRRFGSGVSEENGAGEIPALLTLGNSGSNKSRASEEDANKAAGGLAATAAAGSGSDIDAQARAEEEFKKGMYEPNASSSDDDEEATKNKRRIRINIKEKQGSGSTVDLNKVKEATKRFQLGDSMRGVRSQRLGGSGSQDPTMGSGSGGLSIPGGLDFPGAPPPYPVTAPPSSGTAAPSMMMGVGVASGPIPEDIFQGESTIPSFQAYPPPQQQQQLYPGQWSMSAGPGAHPPPPQEGFVSYPSGVPPQYQGGPPPPPAPLPPGAAPATQMAQQPGGPPLPPLAPSQSQPVQRFTPADISLPDGGVPPKAPPATEPAGAADPSRPGRPGAGAQPPTDLSALAEPGRPPQPTSPKGPPKLGQVPRGAPASKCFKVGLAHVEQNQLTDAMSCFNEAFLALAKDQSLGVDVKPQARICAQYKIAVLLLQEIARLQRVEGQGAVGAKEEMARLSRHLSSLPLQAKHRISCIRTAIKRNMDVQNYAFSKKMLDLLISKAPTNKQEDLQGLVKVCLQRGLTDRTIDGDEDASQFCAATMGRLPTIGHDSCDTCGAKFSALTSPGCIVCGMGTVQRSDVATGPSSSPFS